jgi:membrane-associated protein
MEIISQLVDFILHLDVHLNEIIKNFGLWTYLILFVIIFLETGVVITPFLPGDSLLFAAGSFAALGSLNVFVLAITLTLAAIIGDSLNYLIGHFIGPRAFSGNIRFLKKEYLDRTHEFYERHGGKTIILARFIPIIRTFAPFVAGIGAMDYPHFFFYNVVGAVLWVFLFTFGGYFFGNLTIVKDNFTIVILMIIVISVLPGVFEFAREKLRSRKEAEAVE